MASPAADRPSPGSLWFEAEGNGERYIELMREHGYLVTCECACHADGSGHCDACKPKLPCGWPREVADG